MALIGRRFFWRSCAAFVTVLGLKACQNRSSSAKNSTTSDLGSRSLSLESVTIGPTNGQSPTHLMVCLHGWGANSQDLVPLASALNLPNVQFLFPDAPFPHPDVPWGNAWYALESPNNQGLEESRQKLIDWLTSLEESTGVPLSRTILSGFSQGGAMALDVGLRLPCMALVSMSGYWHDSVQLTRESLPPVLIVHGRQDPVVPISKAQHARDNLKALGITVTYQEFDMAHQILPEELMLVRRFVLDVIG
jgi:phospholipase/carboxylesterase